MDDNKFTYRYSATTDEEKREIEEIKRKYSGEEREDDGLTKLRKLDSKVKNLPFAVALVMGIVGVLVFGLGLTMVLEWKLLTWGIVVMLAGTGIMLAAYPVQKVLLDKNKKKYGEQIIALSESLLRDGAERSDLNE